MKRERASITFAVIDRQKLFLKIQPFSTKLSARDSGLGFRTGRYFRTTDQFQDTFQDTALNMVWGVFQDVLLPGEYRQESLEEVVTKNLLNVPLNSEVVETSI